IVLLMPLFAYLAFGWSPAMLILLPGLLLAWRVVHASGAAYNRCLLYAGLSNLLYVLLALLSL
ncbi:MAG: hypothetical protein IJ680_09050, partial [Paludibacteraceae bacterium]|nr:hypothetical protein [Paludibacteraceae bacterium]